MPPFNIAIIGAGPAGLTLARLLVPSSAKVTIFEAEASATPGPRAQGGTLDLHDETGLAAIREAGLYDEFLKHARFDGEAIAIADKKLLKYVSMGGATANSSRGRPEIDRQQLRRLLVESLPDGVVQWGHRLSSVDEDLTLHFENGVTARGFDLVVGADGAWSKIRPLVSQETPFYTGITGVNFKIADAEARYPELHKLVNRGSLFTFSDRHAIMVQLMGDGSLVVGEWAVRDEGWAKTTGYKTRDIASLKTTLLEEYHDWAPELKRFIEVSDNESATARSLYMLPVDTHWEHQPGVTLLGDAAHLMSPFAGEGVNLAMDDALRLARAIIEAEKIGSAEALTQTVRAFEQNMFKRATAIQKLTLSQMQCMFFVDGAPRASIAQYVSNAITSQEGGPVNWALTGLVYTFYWFFKLIY